MMAVMVLTLSTTYAFSGEDAINQTALNAFSKDFAQATDVHWTTGTNYYRVSFTQNGQKLAAYYTTDGEFSAMSRMISTLQLPLYLQNSLKSYYSNYWVSDAFELSSTENSSYYVTVENGSSKIILVSSNGNAWSVYNKAKKA